MRRLCVPVLGLLLAGACSGSAPDSMPSSSTVDIGLITEPMSACLHDHGFEAVGDPTGYSVEVAPGRQEEFEEADTACREQLRDAGILPPSKSDTTSTSQKAEESPSATSPGTTVLDDQSPVFTTGWSLQSGDALVANSDGVHIVRDGQVVATPIVSAVDVAVPDLEGGLVFTTPPPETGNQALWRVSPDGTTTEIIAASDLDRVSGPFLFNVAAGYPSSPAPVAIFTMLIAPPGGEGGGLVSRETVHAQPLTARDLDGLSIQTPGEGGVTGLGWLDAEGVFVMSEQSDGGSSLTLWDSGGNWVPWPGNPQSYDARCASDPGFNGCLAAATVIPGTSRIAYVAHDLPGFGIHNDERVTELVIFDLSTSQEIDRVTVLDGPGYSTRRWFLHASATHIALTWGWTEQSQSGEWEDVDRSVVYDLATRTIVDLPIVGAASVVP